MQELIDNLEKASKVDYLIDTCFLIYCFEKGHTKKLTDFCKSKKTGMSSFNLSELLSIHHRFSGTLNHHMRDFLKQKTIFNVPVDVKPGEHNNERGYVAEFDEKLLGLIEDASDAVLLVLALKLRANILTRDKHHIFTAKAENYLSEYRISVLNEIPF